MTKRDHWIGRQEGFVFQMAEGRQLREEPKPQSSSPRMFRRLSVKSPSDNRPSDNQGSLIVGPDRTMAWD